MPAAQAARCWWPMHDIHLEFEQAIIQATVDLPRIYAENHWVPAGEPTGWRTEEGIDDQNEPCLYLVCDLEVAAIPFEERKTPTFEQVGCGPVKQDVPA